MAEEYKARKTEGQKKTGEEESRAVGKKRVYKKERDGEKERREKASEDYKQCRLKGGHKRWRYTVYLQVWLVRV